MKRFKMIRTRTTLIKSTEELNKMLIDSRALYDQSLYFLRQSYFETKKLRECNSSVKFQTPNFFKLCKIVKETDIFKNSNLDYVIKQAVIKQVSSNWNSFMNSIVKYNKCKSSFTKKPNLPNYLKNAKKEYNLITINKFRFGKKNCKNNEIQIPKSTYKIILPPYINKSEIKCLRILKFYDKIKIEIIYEKITTPKSYVNDHSIGIDLGVNNLMAITSNEQNFSWLINGRPLKSMNQYYNKKFAKLSALNASNQIQKLNKKRRLKIDNYLHWASKEVIKLCLKHKISKIIIGKNNRWKTKINIGKRNNQSFVNIPHAKLIQMITYKAEENDIKVIITEESYTSKIDHLIKEDMSNQKKYLGHRIKRGLFKSSNGKIINADINGAIGMLRKANVITDVQLLNLSNRGDLVSPMVFKKVS